MAILLKNILEKKQFFPAILTLLMAALDAQQNFMSTGYLFFFLSLLDQKLYRFLSPLQKTRLLLDQ